MTDDDSVEHIGWRTLDVVALLIGTALVLAVLTALTVIY